MQTILLHLSDIHIKTGHEVALSRARKIKEACHAVAPNAQNSVIVLSGDIAYSGLATQYEPAYAFLEELRGQLLGLPSIERVEFVAVPGNHDCDFTSESDIRQYLLQDVQTLYESGLNPSSDRVKVILEVQKNFFAFEARLTRGKEIGFDQRLSYVRIVKFGNVSIKFQCYNTAWLSRKNELQGKLFLPNDAIEPASADANICVSVFHHPYNWLDSNNYRLLKDAVEQTSDFVFTGHEHVQGGGAVERFSGEQLHYVEAAAFNENGLGDASAFSVVVLDLDSGEQRLEEFRWDRDLYVSRLQQSWGVIIKNPARERHLLKLNPATIEQLTNAGAAFRHRRKRNLRLDDFYVYPDLAIWSVQHLAEGKKTTTAIRSKEVLDHFRKTPRVLVTGPDRSGKTSLLKKLFMDLSTEYVPVMLLGKDFEGRISEIRFHKLVASAVEIQYGSHCLDRFLQLDPSRRILLIDDFHQSNLSGRNEMSLVHLAQNMFGHVFIAAADVYRVRNLTLRGKEKDPFDDFENCEIKEFGHRLRGHLISKWLALGRDAASEIQLLDYETRATEKVITTLLGRNVVPAVPFNILSLLHSMESAQPHAVLDGSYGSFIELLIKANFGLAGASIDDPDIKLTYTSVIAYAMFEQERVSLSETELRKVHQEFVQTFDVSPNFPAVLTDLEAARVLERTDGNYSFKYKHVYFYFVAKYFERSLKRQSHKAAELRSKLAYMADRLHNEELANILLFYLYLTQDWQLTNYILANARAIYADRGISDLETDVEFVNKIYKEPPKMLLDDGDIEKHREKYREAMDEADEQDANVSLDAKVTYSDELSDLHKANIAFKTLQVLGQILRSSAGSMEGDIKLEITTTCYMLGLRTLRALLGISENNLEEFRLYLSMLIKERTAVNDGHISDGDLLKRTDEALIWLTFACAYGIIKKISYSVGHHHLADTYERVLQKHGASTSVKMVDLSIKLDHDPIVPLAEITQLRDRVVKNTFGYTLLRQLIADFLYLYRIDFRTLQKLGSMFKIEGTTGPAFLLPDHKRD